MTVQYHNPENHHTAVESLKSQHYGKAAQLQGSTEHRTTSTVTTCEFCIPKSFLWQVHHTFPAIHLTHYQVFQFV
jgi:hypothetical protein